MVYIVEYSMLGVTYATTTIAKTTTEANHNIKLNIVKNYLKERWMPITHDNIKRYWRDALRDTSFAQNVNSERRQLSLF